MLRRRSTGHESFRLASSRRLELREGRRGVAIAPVDGGSIAGNTARLLSAQIAANTGYFVAVLLLARGLARREAAPSLSSRSPRSSLYGSRASG
jgi:hypothetical protein